MMNSGILGGMLRRFAESKRVRQSQRKKRRPIAMQTEALEIRALLSSDVTAHIVAGSLFISGNDSQAGAVLVHQDAIDSTKFDVEGSAGTTINGSAAPAQFALSDLTGNIFVNLTGDTTLSISGTPSISSPPITSQSTPPLNGGVFISLHGNGHNQVTLQDFSTRGPVYVTTGSGDDIFNLNRLNVGGVTSISSGDGNDELFTQGDTFHSFYATMGAGDNIVDINATVNGALSIWSGVGHTGNNLIDVFAPTTVTGGTYIYTGNGNNAIAVGGNLQPPAPPTGPVTTPPPVTTSFGSIYIQSGRGTNGINVTGVSADSLAIVSGDGVNLVNVGGAVTIPANLATLLPGVNLGAINNLVGRTVSGGPTSFRGGVLVETFGSGNLTTIQQATFGGSLIVYNSGGQNTLAIDDVSVSGVFAAYMGGTNNTINVERNASLTGNTTFNSGAIFYFFGATSNAGGGTVNIGVPSTPTQRTTFNSGSLFVGAQLNTASNVVFSSDPLLVFSNQTDVF